MSQFGFGQNRNTDNCSNNNDNGDEELNDPERIIGRVGEEHMRNVAFFVGFVAKFLQSVVATALLLLAIEWQPLRNFLQEHLLYVIISYLVLGLVLAALMIVKFRGRRPVIMIVNFLFFVNVFMALSCIESFGIGNLVFSPYWTLLCAVTQTTVYFFLSVLVCFQIATYRGCAIYGYTTLVPLLFLVLSQPYYFWWYLKPTAGVQEGAIELHSQAATTIAPEVDTTSTSETVPVEFEQKAHHEMVMSYSDYMINVCSGIGLATVMTFEMVAWSQYSARTLKFKAGTGILSGSFTALADNDVDSDGANNQPVNL